MATDKKPIIVANQAGQGRTEKYMEQENLEKDAEQKIIYEIIWSHAGEYKFFLENEGKLPDGFKPVQNPFEDDLIGVGRDGLSDCSGVSYWLSLNNESDINEAVKSCCDWKKLHTDYYLTHKVSSFYQICSEKVVILVDPSSDLKLTAKTIDLCIANDIRVAFVKSRRVLYDLSEQREYKVSYTEYPGSVDDAAVYGEWYLYK